VAKIFCETVRSELTGHDTVSVAAFRRETPVVRNDPRVTFVREVMAGYGDSDRDG
jgi:hypothetical protein